jgi:hypothetical protein
VTGDLWKVRALPDDLALEMRGNPPGLVLVQGDDRVGVELAHVKTVIAAMGNAAADSSGALLLALAIRSVKAGAMIRG